MSRLYDRIAKKGLAISPKIKTISTAIAYGLKEATVVDISDSSRFFLSVDEREEWDVVDDFPTIVPPFENGFYEWKAPLFSYSKKLGRLPIGYSSAGFLLGRLDFDSDLGRYVVADFPGVELDEWSRLSPRWICTGYLLMQSDRGSPAALHSMYIWLLDDSGRMVRDESCEVAHMSALLLDIPDEQTARQTLNAAQTVKFPLLFGLNLMNCKNVKLEQISPPEKLSRKHQKKTGKPLTKYYTLDVKPIKQILETQGRLKEVGLKQSLHLCRGHFKTYTEEKPLMGRHTGTYWWAQHMKGNKSAGRIEKDYRVKV